MKERERIIQKQWRAGTVSWDGDTLVIDHEFDHPAEIIAIDEFMHDLARSKEPLFYISDGPTTEAIATQLGERFLRCLKIDVWAINRIFNRHKLSPYFALFARHVEESSLPGIGLWPDTVVHFNSWAEDIRAEAKVDAFVKTIDDHERAMRKNAASLLKYIRGLHEAHAKLVVVRLDLGYSAAYRLSLGEEGVDPIMVKRDLNSSLKYLRSKFPNMVGYAWKLEYGSRKSYHYHLMLFFNGHEVREDVTLGQLIGDHWDKMITAGNGTHWNCNAKKDAYAKLGLLGIGTIRYCDGWLRANLERAALYLTKVDYYVRLNAPGIGRTFGKGVLPPISEPRRGRPRAFESVTAFAA